jgi:hypothetical protein
LKPKSYERIILFWYNRFEFRNPMSAERPG